MWKKKSQSQSIIIIIITNKEQRWFFFAMLFCTLIVPQHCREKFLTLPEKDWRWWGRWEKWGLSWRQKEREEKAGAMPRCLREQAIHIQAEGSGARLAHRTRRSPEDEPTCRKITADKAARVNISLAVCHSSVQQNPYTNHRSPTASHIRFPMSRNVLTIKWKLP